LQRINFSASDADKEKKGGKAQAPSPKKLAHSQKKKNLEEVKPIREKNESSVVVRKSP